MLAFKSKERKRKEAQGFLAKIMNNNCPRLDVSGAEGRGEQRMNLALAVYVVPVRDGKPDVNGAFSTVTKEISSSGMSLVCTDPKDDREFVVAVPWDGFTTHFWTTIKHQNPLGAGLWQVGVQVDQIIAEGDYPGLSELPVY